MGEVATGAIELGVGAACLVAAAGAWRMGRFRLLAPVLAIAGLAAAWHAVSTLAG